MIIQLKNGREHKVAKSTIMDRDGNEFYILKDWNWNWKRDELNYTQPNEVEKIIDVSGSDFRDGYELGFLHGKEAKEKELIAEGILESDEFDDDEELNLDPLFEMYE